MKIRLKDIAELANVSTATVSMALNHPETSRVSPQKIEEIQKIAKDLNYVPNLAARALTGNSAFAIGIIIPDILNPFFAKLLKSLEDSFKKANYSVLVINTDENLQKDIDAIRSLASKGIDGLIYALSDDTSNIEERKQALRELKCPVVLIDRVLYGTEFNTIRFDNELGGYLATNYLISRGYRKIAHISARKISVNGLNREEGYKKALMNAKIDLVDELVIDGDYSFESGYQAIDKIRGKNVDAIFAANDMMAYGAMKRLKELGVSVGEDICIVGYDNLAISDMFDIPLTTIDQDVNQVASVGAETLISLINKEATEKDVIIDPVLIIKE